MAPKGTSKDETFNSSCKIRKGKHRMVTRRRRSSAIERRRSKKAAGSLDTLSEDVIRRVVGYMDVTERVNVQRVCKKLNYAGIYWWNKVSKYPFIGNPFASEATESACDSSQRRARYENVDLPSHEMSGQNSFITGYITSVLRCPNLTSIDLTGLKDLIDPHFTDMASFGQQLAVKCPKIEIMKVLNADQGNLITSYLDNLQGNNRLTSVSCRASEKLINALSTHGTKLIRLKFFARTLDTNMLMENSDELEEIGQRLVKLTSNVYWLFLGLNSDPGIAIIDGNTSNPVSLPNLKLKWLDPTSPHLITTELLQKLAKQCPKLKCINSAIKCDNLTNIGTLYQLNHLTRLIVCNVKDQYIEPFKTYIKTKGATLKCLKIQTFIDIPCRLWTRIAMSCPRLETFTIYDSFINDDWYLYRSLLKMDNCIKHISIIRSEFKTINAGQFYVLFDTLTKLKTLTYGPYQSTSSRGGGDGGSSDSDTEIEDDEYVDNRHAELKKGVEIFKLNRPKLNITFDEENYKVYFG